MRGSRKLMVAPLAATLALGVSAIGFGAAGDVNQSFLTNWSPAKGKKFKNGSLHLEVDGCFERADGNCDRTTLAPDTERVTFAFSRKNVKFDPGATQECKASAGTLRDLPPDQAVRACGGKKTIIGGGSGAAETRAVSGEVTAVTAELTVFNAKRSAARWRRAAKGAVFFHVRVDSFDAGMVLAGSLSSENVLKLDVPPLEVPAGEARLRSFTVDIAGTNTGKPNGYIQDRCADGKIKDKSEWEYRDAPGTNVESVQKC